MTMESCMFAIYHLISLLLQSTNEHNKIMLILQQNWGSDHFSSLLGTIQIQDCSNASFMHFLWYYKSNLTSV